MCIGPYYGCQGGLTPCIENPEEANGCTDVATDPYNCGACNVICADNEECVGGTCVCSPGYTRCGDACVDTQADPNHCGACGNAACEAGQACVAGACQCSGFQGGCRPFEICENGVCKAVCLDTSGGGVHNGTFVACPDASDNFAGCFCNSCGTTCNYSGGQACCSDGCQYVVTTCADMGH